MLVMVLLLIVRLLWSYPSVPAAVAHVVECCVKFRRGQYVSCSDVYVPCLVVGSQVLWVESL